MAPDSRGFKNEMTIYRCFGLASIVSLLVMPVQAQAYLDPSSGSMLLQIVIGAFLAGLVTVKMYWRKICSVFRRNPPSSE